MNVPDQLSVDKQRVSLLLAINTILIHKSVLIQNQIVQVSQNGNPHANTQLPKLNELLQHLLKRLHSNLTCIGELSERSQNGNSSKIIFPSILNAPPEFLGLEELYINLQKLFPEGVNFLRQKQAQLQQLQQQQQQQQQPNGVRNPTFVQSPPMGHQLMMQQQEQHQQQQQQQQKQQQQQSGQFW